MNSNFFHTDDTVDVPKLLVKDFDLQTGVR